MGRLGQLSGLEGEGKMQGLSCELVAGRLLQYITHVCVLGKGKETRHNAHPHEMTQVISSHILPVVVGDRESYTSKT